MTAHLPTQCTVECDECNTDTEVDLSEFAGSPPTVGVDDLPEGWDSDGDDTHWCPECSGKGDIEL